MIKIITVKFQVHFLPASPLLSRVAAVIMNNVIGLILKPKTKDQTILNTELDLKTMEAA